MFPGGCCDDSAIIPSSMYPGYTPMPHGVTSFAPAVDRQRHPYVPHLQQQHHHNKNQLQLSFNQLHDTPMQHHDHTSSLYGAMSSSPLTPLDNGYRSMSSSHSSPMSSSSSMSPMSYRPGYSPNQQPYDCHGVPAHPSVADYPPQSHNPYYITYENNHPPAPGLNNAQVPLPTQPPCQTLQNYNNNNYYNNYNNNNIKYNNINNNNNNTYTDRYKCQDLQQITTKLTVNK